MRFILSLLISFITLFSFGQSCDTTNGEVINCTDKEGLKQGFWELTKKNILVSGYRGLGTKDGCHYFEKVEIYPQARGNYIDGEKTGVWEYFSDEYLNLLVRRVTYGEDGSIQDENISDRYVLMFGSNLTPLKGQFFHDLDSVNIEFTRNNCIFRLSTGEEIHSFEFNDLSDIEYELLRLKLGIYDRQIKMKIGPVADGGNN